MTSGSSVHATTGRSRVRSALCAMLAACTLLAISRVDAGQARAQMQVSATVTEAVTLRQIHQAQTIAITERDVSSGYVEASGASRFELSGNVTCMLEFRPTGSLFRDATARAGGVSTEIGEAGGTLLLPRHGANRSTVELNYRFKVPKGLTPGIYRWPLTVTVLPLSH